MAACAVLTMESEQNECERGSLSNQAGGKAEQTSRGLEGARAHRSDPTGSPEPVLGQRGPQAGGELRPGGAAGQMGAGWSAGGSWSPGKAGSGGTHSIVVTDEMWSRACLGGSGEDGRSPPGDGALGFLAVRHGGNKV